MSEISGHETVFWRLRKARVQKLTARATCKKVVTVVSIVILKNSIVSLIDIEISEKRAQEVYLVII